MSVHKKFKYKNIKEVQEDIHKMNLQIDLSSSLAPLHRRVKIGQKETHNSIAILPMEGCDSNKDGSPSELVKRRYYRFASGGAGLIWWEANAVVEEGKANPCQMMITEKNSQQFKKLVFTCNQMAIKENGYKPLNILQLTHAGRYSRPFSDHPRPMILQHDPVLDQPVGIDSGVPVLTDDYLDGLVDDYVKSAELALEAGFDGVDIKACHRYLISELLASRIRTGKYGGSFENRVRFLIDVVEAVKAKMPKNFIVASRYNVFDAHPFPYGFGCARENLWSFNPDEPVKIAKWLHKAGVDLLSTSAGNPYYIYPHVTRPFDVASEGIPIPKEHPLESIERLFMFSRQIQKAVGKVPVVGNGYTWLRQFSPYAAASNILKGDIYMMGLGRMALAYPEAARDILQKGELDPKKCCITCSKCTQIMRNHGKTGCVIKDSDIYLPLYNQSERDKKKRKEKEKK